MSFTTFVIWLLGISKSFASALCESTYDISLGCNITYGNVVQSFDSIHSVAVCSLKCSGNDQCLSIKYDKLNMVCELNSERYQSLNTECPVKLRYAKKTKNSCFKMIGDACSDTSECKIPKNQCVNNKCQCDPGYSYRYINESCLTSCDVYGSTFTLYSGYNINGYNNRKMSNAASGEVCEQACAEESGFVCRTVDYWAARKECYLSVQTAFTAPNSFAQESGLYHYHRNCQ